MFDTETTSAADIRNARVISVVTFDGHDEAGILAFAAPLAAGLDHALAAAIVGSAGDRSVAFQHLDRFREATPAGVAASVGGRAAILGNSAFLTKLGMSIASLDDCAQRLRQRGQTVVFVAIDGRPAALLGIV